MSFASDLSKFSDEAFDNVKQVRNGILLGLFAAIIKDTPVRVGDLRGNWQMSVDSMNDIIVSKGDNLYNTQTKLNAFRGNLQSIEMGNTIFFFNNLPYAYRIEYEQWSQKAANGMVRININRFEKFVKRAIKLLS